MIIIDIKKKETSYSFIKPFIYKIKTDSNLYTRFISFGDSGK